mgnify:CR=1 FL=1
MAKSKIDLFLELAKPDENGVSRWVFVDEFVGDYSPLVLGNGFSWGRKSSPLQKKYIVKVRRDKTPGNAVDGIKLDGFNDEEHFCQTIRKDIVETIRRQKCVMLGINGSSENTLIEVDHKDGRKSDMRVSDARTQKLEDFQPLCKAANDVKRQICKNCKMTDKRWDATNIKGNPYPFYEGDENYTEDLGCVGCYQYDPVEYCKSSVKRICKEASEHTAEYIMHLLYPENN